MSATDPIADMLTRMRNAALMRRREVQIPASKLRTDIARILKEEGFIRPAHLQARLPGLLHKGHDPEGLQRARLGRHQHLQGHPDGRQMRGAWAGRRGALHRLVRGPKERDTPCHA